MLDQQQGSTNTDLVSGNSYSVDEAVRALTASGAQNRSPNGQFAAKAEEKAEIVAEEPEKVAEKPAEEKAEAKAAEPAAEDDDLEFELPGEEGKEPVRRKLSQLWEGFDQAEKLRAEVEQLKTRATTIPPEYSSALKDIVAERGRYLQGIQQLARMINPQEPSLDMLNPNHASYDPDGYYRARQSYDNGRQALARINSEQDELAKQQRAQEEMLYRAHLERESQALDRVWPELRKDERVQAQLRTDLAKVYGFTNDEISSIADHRQLMVIKDALELRALKAKQDEAVKVVRSKPKLVKGTARNTTDPKATARTNAMARLQQTGSMDAAVAAIKGLI